jgi:putative ABC transport system substrate-binding protein
MRRREFITLLGGAAATWPIAARAQSSQRVPRIGVLMAAAVSDDEGQRYIKAFLKGLQGLGWEPGRNVRIDFRWGASDADRIQGYAAEIVTLKPDVILAQTALTVAPLRRETRTIPIVFVQIFDPLESGFVTSLARPTGNITGFTPADASISGKWLELLKEIAPGVTRVAVLLNPVQSPQIGMCVRSRLRPLRLACL